VVQYRNRLLRDVSVLQDAQNPTEHSSEKPALTDSALSRCLDQTVSTGAFLPQLVCNSKYEGGRKYSSWYKRQQIFLCKCFSPLQCKIVMCESTSIQHYSNMWDCMHNDTRDKSWI